MVLSDILRRISCIAGFAALTPIPLRMNENGATVSCLAAISRGKATSTLLATAAAVCVLLAPNYAWAAAHSHAFDGSQLGLIWIVPFVGLLLSIAIGPLASPRFWPRHYGKIALFWGMVFVIAFLAFFGVGVTLDELLHVLLLEYLPFIILIASLFTIAGGIFVGGNLHGSPAVNTAFLAAGTGLASFIGTQAPRWC